MAFTYGYYIKPYIFILFIATAIIGALLSVYLMWAESQGSVKTCLDFGGSQTKAQKTFLSDKKRYANLDRDRDGKACEILSKSK